jgi:hypothetical protein
VECNAFGVRNHEDSSNPAVKMLHSVARRGDTGSIPEVPGIVLHLMHVE